MRYRPSIVSDRAVAALFYWLADQSPAPVAISWFEDIWRIERATSITAAIAFLSYTLELRQCRQTDDGQRIIARASPKAERRWQATRDEVLACDTARPDEKSALYRLLDQLYSGRWSILGAEMQERTISIIRQGSGYPPLDQAFRIPAGSNGYRIAEIADVGYRDWVEATALETAIIGRPRFEDVDAIVDWPHFGDMRTRYWRFLVPLEVQGSLCRLLTVSGNDSGIDLRPKHVEKPGGAFGGLGSGHPEQGSFN